jgi:hypothetical protein
LFRPGLARWTTQGFTDPPTEFFDVLVVCRDVFGLLETICTVRLLKVT